MKQGTDNKWLLHIVVLKAHHHLLSYFRQDITTFIAATIRLGNTYPRVLLPFFHVLIGIVTWHSIVGCYTDILPGKAHQHPTHLQRIHIIHHNSPLG